MTKGTEPNHGRNWEGSLVVNKVFSECLIISDAHPWLNTMIQNAMTESKLKCVRFTSNIQLRNSFNRFEKAPFIVIHWEGVDRKGGAIIEEIKELDQNFDIENRILVITTNPTHEDVYYFNELGVTSIISAIKKSAACIKSIQSEICSALKKKQEFLKVRQPSRHTNIWQTIHSKLDSLPDDASSGDIDAIASQIKLALRAQNNKVNATYLDALARVAHARRQIKKAQELWEQALELNPNHVRSYHNLPNFFEKEKEYQQALALMHRLNKLNKNSITRTVKMGEVHRRLKQPNKAEHYFKLALEKDQFCSRALNGLAELRFDQGNLQEARDLLERSHFPDKTASYLNARGISLVQKKKFAEALEVYKNAQFVLPTQEKGPLLFFNIGLCYSRWGKLDLAKEYLKLALIKQPDYTKATRLLERIDGLS